MLISIILIVLYSVVIYLQNKRESFKDSGQLLEQVENRYEEMIRSYEEKLEIYKEDYLNRTYMTDFILTHDEEMRSYEGLNQIKELMGVDAIHVVNAQGEIALSSEKEAVNLNLLEHEEAKSVWEFIEGSDEKEFVIDIHVESILDAKARDFIAVRSSIPGYVAVEIGLDESIFEKLEDTVAIREVLKYMPVTYEQIVLAIDAETGEIIAQTINEENHFKLEEDILDVAYLNKLKEASKGDVFKINEAWKFIRSKQIGDIFIVAIEDSTEIMSQIYREIYLLVATTIITLIVVLRFLNIAFKKYVFNDLKHIEDHIRQIVSGNINIQFRAENKEYESVTTLLNDWKKSYTEKSERMSIIMGSVGKNVAVFECLYTICSNFFSDNMQSILGVNDAVWHKITQDPEELEKYIQQLLALKSRDETIYVGGKYLEIKAYKLQYAFFGVIIDRTEEVKKNQKMISQLKEAKQAAETDYLTGLLNRTGFENRVRKSLERDAHQGVMMICDLDHFKRINDHLGHPEGDKVLKLIGDFLKEEFRREDSIGRLGGDEFIVFIEHKIPEEVLIAQLKSMLSRVREVLIDYYNQFDVSMSIGVTYFQCPKNSYKELYHYADEALYVAKKLGKDRFYIDKDIKHCRQQGCVKCEINSSI